MTKTITINPVTRIEGHARITLHLGDDNKVQKAYFHVNEFRGFEKFCEGRLYTEMPTITPRICGICPTSHSMASAKACDTIQRLSPTPTGVLLRRLVQAAQMLSSHALSFFHLSSPDLLLGFDADVASRNILGLAAKDPALAVKGIRLRKLGQEVSERVTGKKIHVLGVVPGGMAYPLLEEDRVAILAQLPEALETAKLALKILKDYISANRKMVDSFAMFESPYLGTVAEDGALDFYDGKLRWVNPDGSILAEAQPSQYQEFIAERSMDFTYLKYPYFKPLGFEKGFYQVGTLGRINAASKISTPLAQAEFKTFRAINGGKPVHGAFYHHYARLIEMLYSVEELERLLNDPRITDSDIQARGHRNALEGVGHTEAPRGTLFHHYKVDDTGALTKVNLLIATGQNNPAMNQAVLEVAKQYVDGNKITEGALNRVEHAIRCYDPCLSCSTHALGHMPIDMELHSAAGEVVDHVVRGS
jgi:NAD-reducing hydrogenase large subunit